MSEEAIGGVRSTTPPKVTQTVCEYHMYQRNPFEVINRPCLARLGRVASKLDAPKDSTPLADTTSVGRAAREYQFSTLSFYSVNNVAQLL